MKVALNLASFNVVEARLDDFKEIVENYVNILFANEDEARSFTGMNPEDALNLYGYSLGHNLEVCGQFGSLLAM